MKKINHIIFLSVKQGSLLNFVLLCLAMPFLFTISSFCGKPVTIDIYPKDDVTYILSSTGEYTNGIDQLIGYQISSKKKFRKAFTFDLSSIPSIATINECKIKYTAGDECGVKDGVFKFTQMPYDWPDYWYEWKIVYDMISTGDLIKTQSIDTYQEYTTDLASYIDAIQDAIESSNPKIGLGVYNQYEGASYGSSFSGYYLKITYTLPTPPAPTNLHVKTGTKTAGSMKLAWDAPGGDVTGYKVFKDGSLYDTTSNTEMQICNLIPNNPYNFFVKAYNGYGDGDPSSSITESTKNSYIAGESLICNIEEYELTNIPSGAMVTWNDPAILTLLSDENDNPVEYQKYSNGNATITATVSSGCENYVQTKQVHSGPYSSLDYPISGTGSAQCESYVYYSIPQLSGVTSINWTWPQGWTYVSGQNTRYLALMTGTQGGVVAVGVDNNCGHSGSYSIKYTAVYGYCGFYLSLSPNPASDIVNVSIKEDKEESVTSTSDTLFTNKNEDDVFPTSFKISIIDKMGVTYYSVTGYDRTFTIPVRNLKNGTYFIIVDAGKFKLSGTLEVLH